ncbi:hypothetical protein [Shimia biformata]|uniref:hypothetical protein n=1 Tax=Shimia biformata TaxID=1294299 RepID=UPI00194E0CB5|nr:hypothetical protein [Shimia biformata]
MTASDGINRTDRDRDGLRLSDMLTDIPLSSDWCLEMLLNRIANRQEERQR